MLFTLRQNLFVKVLLITLVMQAGSGYSQMIYDTLLLNELEVVAYYNDYSATVKKQTVDSSLLQNRISGDLGTLLPEISPVLIRSYGNGGLATASFRGTGANHTKISWEDFAVNSPMLGQTDLSLVPVSFFDRVELLYGGASLVQASGGVGGTVNLTSSRDNPSRPLLLVSQNAGSFKSFSTTMALNLGSGKINSDSRILFRTAENNFPYYNDAVYPPGEMTQKNSSFQNEGFVQKFTIIPAEGHRLTIASWTQWNYREIPQLMSQAEANEQLSSFEGEFFSRNTIFWNYSKNKMKWEAKGAWFYDDYHFQQELYDPSVALTDTLINSVNKTNSLFFRIDQSTTFSRGFSLSAGFNTDYDLVQSNNYTENKQRNSFGLYADLVKDFKGRTKLNLLIRGQLTDGIFLPVMPLIGMNVRLLKQKDLFLRVSLSRNYHLPTLNDLYWEPGGNVNLKPENSYELEGGFNYLFRKTDKLIIRADVTGYAKIVNNWIQWVDTGTGYWSPMNISEVFSRGVEVTASFESSIRKLQYRIRGQYAFTRATNISESAIEKGTNYDQLVYIPKHAASAGLLLGLKGFTLNWVFLYTGKRNVFGGSLPAYALNNIGFGKILTRGRSSFDLRAQINNVFNVSYQSVADRPMPGRNYEITIKYMLNK